MDAPTLSLLPPVEGGRVSRHQAATGILRVMNHMTHPPFTRLGSVSRPAGLQRRDTLENLERRTLLECVAFSFLRLPDFNLPVALINHVEGVRCEPKPFDPF